MRTAREDLGLVGEHPQRLGRELQLHVDVAPGGDHLEVGDHLDHHVAQVELGELGAARLDLGEREQVLDQQAEPGDVAVDRLPHLALGAAEVVVVLEQLEVAADAGQRGAQLVGDVGDEVVLGAVELAQRLVHLGLDRPAALVLDGQHVDGLPHRGDLAEAVGPGPDAVLAGREPLDDLGEAGQRALDAAGPGCVPARRRTASPSSTASSITATATVQARELASRASCAEVASSRSIRSLASRRSSNARRPVRNSAGS